MMKFNTFKKFVIVSVLGFGFALPTQARLVCKQVFLKGTPEYKVDHVFPEAFPGDLWAGTLKSRTEQFLKKYPQNAKMVKDVQLEVTDGTKSLVGSRPILVISLVIPRTAKYTAQDILADYLRMIGRDTISFPLSEHAGHLYVRFGNKSFDYMPLDMHNYEKPNSYRLEPVIQLTRGEEQKLAQYFRNATDNSERTLGGFEYDGTYNTRGSLKNNKCRGRAGHNCTTWISTAPIGPDQQKLLELVGGTVKQDIGANPGWWSGFLNTKAKKSRVPFSVFFSANSNLKDTLKKVPEGGELVWEFSPH